ncbi:hypothetical protein D3C76_1287200 [compost metagenome]
MLSLILPNDSDRSWIKAERMNTCPPVTANGEDSVPLMPLTTANVSALTKKVLCKPAGPFSIPRPIPAATYWPWALTCIFTAHIVPSLPSVDA